MTTRDITVNLDGSSDFNAPYGTGSWDDVGWINSLSLYDGSGADVYNAHVDLSGSDWTIRSMNIGSEGTATLYLNDVDDGLNRNINALFINTNSVINLSTTNIRHIWGGGDSQELNLGTGRVGNIDLYAATNTINTGSGFIMGITTSGLSNIDVAEGCGIGSIFTDYGSEVHISLHDQSYVDYIQVCGSNSSIEFDGYVDVATVRLEGASISVGDGYVGSILNYAGGGLISVDSGSVGSIQSWKDGMVIHLGTGSFVGTIQSSENGLQIDTNGNVKFLSATGDIGGNEISIGKDGWIEDIWLEGDSNNVVISGGAGNVHTGNGDDFVIVNSGGWAEHIDLGSGDNTASIQGGAGTVVGSEGNDSVWSGTEQIEQINLSGGNNFVSTGAGWVGYIDANEGDDVFSIGSGGAQVVDAELGNNKVYTSNGWVNSIAAGDGDDHITVGIGGAGAVMTWGGNDVIDLYGWVGSLQTGGGDDKITIESSMGWNGSPNMFSGGRGSDLFIIRPQDDPAGRMVVDGGSDGAADEHDTVDFSFYKTGLMVTLGGLDSTIQNTGAGYVSLISVENIIGGSGNDVVTDAATSAAIDNLFIGGAGNDALSGGLGNDTLIGDTGKSSFSIASTSVKYVGGDYEQPTLIADVTGDGINDLVVTGRVFVVPGIVNGSLGTSYEIKNNFGYQQTTKIGDVNGDGKLDLITQNSVGWGSYVHVLLNNGTGGFSNAATYSTPSDGMAVVGDVNGDGFDDLIIPDNASNQIEIRLSTGSSGILSEAITVDVGGVEGFAKIVDLDGNGTNEIFILNPVTGETRVVEYDGGSAEVFDGPDVGGDIGTFGLSLTGVELVDLTNDGRLDGIIGRTDGSIDILENRADGTVYLLDRLQMASHAKVLEIKVADLNGDGIDDILALAGEPFDGSSTLSLFTGLGDGHFSSETVLDVRTGGGLFAVGDLNGDDVSDITRTNWGSGNAVILYGSLAGIADADSLYGGAGNDSLAGGGGADVLNGGAGNDTLDGAAGNDSMAGGANDDTYTVDSSADAVTENQNEGTDTVQSSITYLLASNIENLTLTGTAAINGTGNTLSNILTGNSGANGISGGGGNDTIIGGDGNDTLEGAAGNDSLTGGDGIDIASYAGATAAVTVNLTLTSAQNTGGAGTDTLATIENLIGSAYNDTLTGDANANSLSGGNGTDSVSGGAGNDTLDGGAGNDRLSGGANDDTYVVDSSSDVVFELVNGGTDLVQSSAASYTLTAEVENLTLTGSAAINGTGNLGNNVLTGNSAANSISGGGGNDTIIGGAGNDTLEGAAGNDSLTGGDGIDTASYNGSAAAVTVNLSLASAQNTVGAGTDTLTTIENLIGSAYNDTLTGDANANMLSGGTGNDSLTGGAGNDTLDGGAGNDVLTGGDGTDTASYASATAGVTVDLTLTTAQNTVGGGTDTLATFENLIGSSFNDLLTGTATVNQLEGGTGADTLVGGAGADLLYGGDGDDRFVITAAADLATGEVITGGNGTDELRFTSTTASTLTLTSGVGVEKVVIGTGTAASADSSGTVALNVNAASAANGMTIIGNAGANILTGTGYNDSIDGGLGNDTLLGGAGKDTIFGGGGNDNLTGGADADTFMFNIAPNATSNLDTITDFVSGTDHINLAKSVMAALGTVNSALIADAFWQGAGVVKGHDATDRIVYNTSTGVLYYDADGSGSGAAVQLAQLGTTASHPASLTAADFFVF